jgi:hypothetical protein
MFPWKNRSIKSTKFPITYPAASTAKFDATVTTLTSIVDGSSSGFSERRYGLKILFQIPLSDICANLRRKLYYIKGLILCYFKIILTKHYSYGYIKSKKNNLWIKDINDITTVRYVKVLSLGLGKIFYYVQLSDRGSETKIPEHE